MSEIKFVERDLTDAEYQDELEGFKKHTSTRVVTAIGHFSAICSSIPVTGAGIGAALLQHLEELLRGKGVKYVYTWTAGYEAPDFYRKQGWVMFVELKNWYQSGHPRVGLQKKL